MKRASGVSIRQEDKPAFEGVKSVLIGEEVYRLEPRYEFPDNALLGPLTWWRKILFRSGDWMHRLAARGL